MTCVSHTLKQHCCFKSYGVRSRQENINIYSKNKHFNISSVFLFTCCECSLFWKSAKILSMSINPGHWSRSLDLRSLMSAGMSDIWLPLEPPAVLTEPPVADADPAPVLELLLLLLLLLPPPFALLTNEASSGPTRSERSSRLSSVKGMVESWKKRVKIRGGRARNVSFHPGNDNLYTT